MRLSKSCGGPPLAHSVSRSEIALVYGQCVAFSCEPGYTINMRDAPSATSPLSCKENDFELSAPVSSSPVMCNKPEFGNDEQRLDVIKKFPDS